jgi:hypothetical protein
MDGTRRKSLSELLVNIRLNKIIDRVNYICSSCYSFWLPSRFGHICEPRFNFSAGWVYDRGKS